MTAVMSKFNSAVYAMKSIKKHTAQRAGGVRLTRPLSPRWSSG